jgi:hypothetical protein
LYWHACLEFQKIQGKKGVKAESKKARHFTIKSKLLVLINTRTMPLLVLVKSDGTSRKVWKFISETELSKADRSGNYSLNKIWFDPIEPDKGISLCARDNGIRIIRERENEEVPDYLTEVKDSSRTKSISGVYHYGDIYWIIAFAPNDKLFKNIESGISKVQKPGLECKSPDMIELYPIHFKEDDDPADRVYLAHKLRDAAHQYKGTLRLPLPLHLAQKLRNIWGKVSLFIMPLRNMFQIMLYQL